MKVNKTDSHFLQKNTSNTKLNNKTDSTNLGKRILILEKFYHINLHQRLEFSSD